MVGGANGIGGSAWRYAVLRTSVAFTMSRNLLAAPARAVSELPESVGRAIGLGAFVIGVPLLAAACSGGQVDDKSQPGDATIHPGTLYPVTLDNTNGIGWHGTFGTVAVHASFSKVTGKTFKVNLEVSADKLISELGVDAMSQTAQDWFKGYFDLLGVTGSVTTGETASLSGTGVQGGSPNRIVATSKDKGKNASYFAEIAILGDATGANTDVYAFNPVTSTYFKYVKNTETGKYQAADPQAGGTAFPPAEAPDLIEGLVGILPVTAGSDPISPVYDPAKDATIEIITKAEADSYHDVFGTTNFAAMSAFFSQAPIRTPEQVFAVVINDKDFASTQASPDLENARHYRLARAMYESAQASVVLLTGVTTVARGVDQKQGINQNGGFDELQGEVVDGGIWIGSAFQMDPGNPGVVVFDANLAVKVIAPKPNQVQGIAFDVVLEQVQ